MELYMAQQKKEDDLEKTLEEGIEWIRSIKKKAKTYMAMSQDVMESADQLESSLIWTKDHIEGFRVVSSDPADPLFGAAQRYSSTLGSVVYTLKNTDQEFTEAEKSLQPVLSGCLVCATSGSEAITAFRAEYSSYYPIVPTPNDSVARIYFDKSPFDHTKIQEQLDRFLQELNPKLVAKRLDTWTAFHSNADNKDSLACYSMRDILTNIIDSFCTVDSVKRAMWWTFARNTKEGVSKWQKIKYFICGDEDSDIEDSVMKLVVRGIDECKRLHDTLVEVAHKATTQEDVKVHLEAMESALLNMFQLRESVKKMRSQADVHI
jgi:hypothetical protein